MQTKHIWVDQFNFSTVWQLFLFSKKEKLNVVVIHHFGKRNSLAGFLSRYFLFPKTKIEKSAYDLYQHDHKDGEALFWHLWRESAEFGVKVSKKSEYSLLVKHLPQHYASCALLYLQRQIAYDQKRRLAIIRLVDWYARNNNWKPSEQIIFLDDKVFQSTLSEYAKPFQLNVSAYNNQHYLLLMIIRVLQLFYLLIKNLCLSILSPLKENVSEEKNAQLKVGVFYAQGADLNKRSDLFWLPQSGINPKDVVVYFLSPKYPPTTNRINELKQLGVDRFSLIKIKDKRISNDADKVERFFYFYKKSLITAIQQAVTIFRNTKINSLIELWQAERFLWLLTRVSLFEALFQACRIRIHFGLFSEDEQNLMAVHIALKKLNGVDTYMHWSHHPEGQLMPAHDVYFSWGPYFRTMFEKFGHGIANLVYTGYQFDDKFETLKKEASTLRDQLHLKKIKFIISFFDNSYWEGGWFSKESLIKINKELLKKVVQNKEWGIIIKPKRATSLKLGSDEEVDALINDLIREGRCILLDKGELPTLAALASDLVIGFGAFSTPATETALANIPVIVYDPSCQFSHALYKEKLKNVVFNDVSQLIQFMDDFALRKLVKVSDRDYNMLLTFIDPFRDSQSAKRTGRFIRDLLEALKQNKSDCEAIEFALKNFVNKYGRDNIIQFLKVK